MFVDAFEFKNGSSTLSKWDVKIVVDARRTLHIYKEGWSTLK